MRLIFVSLTGLRRTTFYVTAIMEWPGAYGMEWVHKGNPSEAASMHALTEETRCQDYKRFSSMDWCSTHNLCSEMT